MNTPQKLRWAARAEMLRAAAEKNDAKAAAGYKASRPTDDPAFWTQPGRNPARDRARQAGQRAFEAQQKAADQRWRAAQLERMANTHAGDAARKREELNSWAAKRNEAAGIAKGARVFVLAFGRCGEVVRVNAKSVTVRMPSGYTERMQPSDIRMAKEGE
jgi:hypothetical protein